MTRMPPEPPMAPPPLPDPAYPPYQPQRGRGMAVAALVLGVLGLIPLLGGVLGLTGIVLAIVVLATRRPGRGLAIGGLVAGIICTFIIQVALLASILMPSLMKAQQLANSAKCMSQLRHIGTALQFYRDDHKDHYPESVDSVEPYAPDFQKLLDCPASTLAGENDYFYFPADRNADPNTFVMCDNHTRHPTGRNVLMVSGAVKRLPEQMFQSELQLPRNAKFARAFRAPAGDSSSRAYRANRAVNSGSGGNFAVGSD